MKYVIFDFNGTILDDVNLCLDLLNDILIKQGKKAKDIDEYRHVFSFPVKDYYIKAGVDFSKDSFEDLAVLFIKEYQPRSLKCNTYPNLVETINLLKEKGIVVGILSASEINNLTEQLNALGIYNLFDFVLGLDNIHAASKVDVGIKYLKDHNINPNDVLFVGDTDHDALVAKKLGASSILFTKGHQARDVLEKENVPLIDDLSEIINYI